MAQPYGMLTAAIFRRYEVETNPVTKGVLRDVIFNRIDALERNRLDHAARIQEFGRRIELLERAVNDSTAADAAKQLSLNEREVTSE